MIMRLYCLFDEKMEECNQPSMFKTDAAAWRQWEKQRENVEYADDKELYFIGTFNTETLEIIGIPAEQVSARLEFADETEGIEY